MTLTHLTKRSANVKTGPIPVSTSSRENCPKTCPFRSNGCYAESGKLRLHWDKVTAGERGTEWQIFLDSIKALPESTFWRHNQAGDIKNPNTAAGTKQLAQLTNANRGRKGYTYTHHRLTHIGVQNVKAATSQGFTVNVSADSEQAADVAISKGLRAVFVVNSAENRRFWNTAQGNRVVVCPAQLHKNIDCKTCKLCQSRPQNVAIAFLAHGNGKRKVNELLT